MFTMSTTKTNKVDLVFAEQVKKARNNAGLSQQEFAKNFEISKGYVQMLENGKRAPSVSLRREIERWIAGKNRENHKIKATIEPGKPEKKALLREAGKRITETDPSLRMMVEWMDEYFRDDPDQIPSFFWAMAKNWPSFDEFLEKKGFGRDRQSGPMEKKSVNDG